ncbi:hypothetical protein ABB37_06342 [Leptomonas pyrrhocoris]|uniref:Uncharacterized protein n=1 Tax=Leptomonas pyrrhocoris TaxID=157538 RepID=A0A0M9FXJ8_LEPPY|nr:hypothetical protein ABB37_06342 [Leptomonas pyrrhocoris]KPA78170.1 hypothetical protein ABB37_06342 [Leptomonas pyrrhocoris]|eukprot:XP_015656609.1 hypothetical protein ABB37_06342 [Leptomonas pyrrhocoris]
MAKKRRQRSANAAAAHTADATVSARPLLIASTTVVTAQEALQTALERLDAIAQEAHVYTRQLKQAELSNGNSAPAAATPTAFSASSSSTVPPHKRPREDGDDITDSKAAQAVVVTAASLSNSRLDVFAATSTLQYRTLCTAVAAFGLQLLPSLEDVSKRVTLAVLTPALSTPEAWETFAMLCTTYRAGMAHPVNEIMESLLREPGVLLLDAPQLVPAWYAETYVHVLPGGCAANTTTATFGGLLSFAEDQKVRDTSSESAPVQHLVRVHTDRAARKLCALVDIIYAAGGYVPSSTLQQMALRHVMEVVESGVLPCYRSASESGEETVAVFHTSSAAAPTTPSTSGHAEASSEGAQHVLRWRVPPAWHAVCLQLLEAFIFTIHPAVPAQLLVAVSHIMNVVSARLHRGVPVLCDDDAPSTEEPNEGATKETMAPPLPVSHAVNAAVVRLGHVLHLLQHPVVLAPYQPPQLTLEKAKRRVWSVDTEATASTPTATAVAVVEQKDASPPTSAQTAAAVPVAPVQAPPTLGAAPVTAAAPPTPSSAPSVERTQLAVKPTPAVPPAATPAAPSQQPSPASKVTAHSRQNEEEENEDIPDVVLED